jgi:putative IMPACT (imprinted ancient) family translation regulator
MEAICSSETSVPTITTWHQIPQDNFLHRHRCENLKSYITEDFVWKNTENSKGQREHFMDNVGPQGAAKHPTETVDVFELFFSRELTDTIVKETNKYAEQFLC